MSGKVNFGGNRSSLELSDEAEMSPSGVNLGSRSRLCGMETSNAIFVLDAI